MGRRQQTGGPDGLVLVDKEQDWTSHDVVAKSRGLLGTRKVGHAGTLDPDATGVLLLGVGKGTKLLRFLSPLGKSYVGEVQLGVETSTLDSSGEVTAVHDMGSVTLTDAIAAAERFVGEIEQVPPMVSSVKVDGQRLHQLARRGIEVEREARPVTIHRLAVGPVPDPPGLRIGGEASPAWVEATAGADGIAFGVDLTCSSGTYVRTLAADLGAALGGGAHLRSLRRTAVGPFTLDGAVRLDELGPERVLPLTDAVRHLERIDATDELAAAVAVGKVLDRDGLGLAPDAAGPWAVIGPAGELLAVYEPHRDATVKPAVVLVGS